MTIRWHQLDHATATGTASASERLTEPPETGKGATGYAPPGPDFLPGLGDRPRPLWQYGHDTTTWRATVQAIEEGATNAEAWRVFLDTTTTNGKPEAIRALDLAVLTHGRKLGKRRKRR